jgi:hypothetical protein
MISARMPRTPKRSAAKTSGRDALAEVVRTKLLGLGSFDHLHVRRQAEHVFIEQPGPPDAPDDRYAVLRLTSIGGFRFGLSLRRHSNRWEKLPVSGVLADVLATAVTMLGPWLAPEPLMIDTSETDY